MIRHALVALAVLSAAPAFAQEEVCSGEVSLEEFAGAMDVVDSMIAKADPDEARYLIQQMHPKVPCLDSPVTADLLVRYGMLRAQVAFFDQDEGAATRWLHFAVFTDPEGDPWPESIPEGHPLRDMLEFADTPERVADPRHGLTVPKGGGAILNGQLAQQPAWYSEVPGLVQVFDKKEARSGGAWVDGSAWTDSLLSNDMEPPEAPKWWTGGVHELVAVEPLPGAVSSTEDAPKEKKSGSGPSIGRLAIGGGSAVLAGTLYAVAAVSAGGMDNATTPDELAATRSRTNLLVVGSSVFAVGAVGFGVTAFISDSPGFAITGRF